jgi:hypothetical protein
MIDFVSTHPGAEPQTVACARLLAAVIAQAVDDASNSNASAGDALAAINWLFNKDTSFEQYATLIGANPQAIRDALLRSVDPHEVRPKAERFDESRRRRLRYNYTQWLRRRQELIERGTIKK